MSRNFRWMICLGILALGAVTSLAAFSPWADAGASRIFSGTGPAAGQRFTIDILPLVGNLRELESGEDREQLRDWALYGVLHYQGLSGADLVKATNESAPLRLPYLEELFTFAYGPGRRAILDARTAVLVIEKDTRDRSAVLARLADQIRMETGEIPSTFRVFSFEADVPRGELRVERLPDIPGNELYGAAYGYSLAEISSEESFKRWLASVDDVTFAQYASGRLTLGGRRFPDSPTLNVNVEDVAALYQAFQTLDRENSSLEATLKSRALAKLRTQPRSSYGQKPISLESFLEPGDKVPPPAPGFSLDPQYRKLSLLTSLQTLSSAPCTLIEEAARQTRYPSLPEEDARPLAVWSALKLAKIKEAVPPRVLSSLCEGIVNRYGATIASIASEVLNAVDDKAIARAMAPFWQLRDQLSQESSYEADLMLPLLMHVSAMEEMQCARYDGPLQGTRVGMNLFYTDLLAKLWIIDFHHSAPGMSIPGFLSIPRVPETPLAEQETRTNPGTRVWFGPKQGSFTITPGDDTVLLRDIATRVYAAGSNPTSPGQESTPAETSRRVIGWWDRHYATVADYEPEFHRQNQIMKWSLLLGWLRSKQAPVPLSLPLSFLNHVPVQRDLVFDQWFEQNRAQLRYQHLIPLRPRSEWVGGRECLDRLSSYPFATGMVTGGVSLGSDRALKSAPRLTLSEPANLRHTSSLGHMGNQEGLDFLPRAVPRVTREGQLSVTATKGTRVRTGGAELHLPQLMLQDTSKRSSEVALALSSQQHSVGTFSIERNARGVRMSFLPGEVEQLRSKLPPIVSTRQADDEHQPLLSQGLVKLGDEPAAFVPLRGNGMGFARLAASDSGAKDSVITLVTGEDKRALTSRAVSARQFQESASKYEWQYLRLSRDPRKEGIGLLEAHFRNDVPSGKQARIIGLPGQSEPLKAVITPEGELAIARPGDPGAGEAWAMLHQSSALRGDRLRAIVERAGGHAEEELVWDVSQSLRAERAFESVLSGEARQVRAIEEVARTHPEGWRGALKEIKDVAVERGERALAGGQSQEALRSFEAAGRLEPESPQMLLRMALAEMQGGQSQRGLEHFEKATSALKGTLEERQLVEHLAAILPDEHLGDVKKVLLMRVGPEAAVSHGLLSQGERLVAHGPDVVSSGQIRKPLGARELSGAERGLLSQDENVVIYLEDRFSTNRHGFESAPAEHLVELEKSVLVSWQEVKAMPDDRYAPALVQAQLQSGTETYVKVKDLRAPRLGRAPMRAIFVRKCDVNGDGVLTQKEEQRCHSSL